MPHVGNDAQAVADVLIVRSGATGEVHVNVQYSVGRRGRETTGGQSILHFDTGGRLRNADVADAVRACVSE